MLLRHSKYKRETAFSITIDSLRVHRSVVFIVRLPRPGVDRASDLLAPWWALVRSAVWHAIKGSVLGRETNFFIVDRVDRERSRGFRGAVELDGTLQEAEFPEVVVLTARV